MKNMGVIICVLLGLILGYAYGFNAYNRPIRRWEFWLKHRYNQ